VAIGYVVRHARSEPNTRKLFDIRHRRKEQFKTRSKNANNNGRWSKHDRHWKRFTDDRCIATKSLLEIVIAQDRHCRQLRLLLLRVSCRRVAGGGCWWRWLRRSVRFLKVSTSDDRPSHHLKEVRRYRRDADAFGRAVQCRKRDATCLDCSEILEIVFCAVAEVEEVDVGERKVFDIPSLQIVAGEDQALWILVRKLPQQHAIRDAEY